MLFRSSEVQSRAMDYGPSSVSLFSTLYAVFRPSLYLERIFVPRPPYNQANPDVIPQCSILVPGESGGGGTTLANDRSGKMSVKSQRHIREYGTAKTCGYDYGIRPKHGEPEE